MQRELDETDPPPVRMDDFAKQWPQGIRLGAEVLEKIYFQDGLAGVVLSSEQQQALSTQFASLSSQLDEDDGWPATASALMRLSTILNPNQKNRAE